jgi:signal transduction histidine kinase
VASPYPTPDDVGVRPRAEVAPEHTALFYDAPADLEAAIVEFAQEGVSAGETVVLIARAARLSALSSSRWPFSARLAQHRDRGDLVVLDADDLLDVLVVNGRVEARAFAESLSRPLDAIRERRGAPIRVYGEVGDILVTRRQYDAAVTLAALWHHETARAPVRRLSAYAIDAFVGPEAGLALERLGRLHGAVRLGREPDAERRSAGYWALLAHQREKERQRLAAALAEAERRAQVGMLAAGLAHDLSNLLLPVLQQAEEMGATAETDEGRRTAESLVHGTQQAAELVKAMMRVATPAPSTTPVSLHKVATLVLTVLRSKLEGVKVKLEVDADLPLVAGHESSLLQVLLNLVQNAREALPDGVGAITVSLARCAAPPGARDDWVRMSVTDTGAGMTAAQQARLFEPFFTTKPQGHGIGLASVRTLVEAMDGRIDVHSTPGRGTVFAVRMRAAASPFR